MFRMDGSTTLCRKRPSFGPKGKDKFSGFRGLDFGFLGFRLAFVGGVSKDVKTKLAPKLNQNSTWRKAFPKGNSSSNLSVSGAMSRKVIRIVQLIKV